MENRLSFVIACGFICACSSQSINEPGLPIIADGEPALHAIQDRELRELMDRMNGLMMERFMTEQEMDVERHRFAERIVESAKILSSTAEALVNKLPGFNLNTDEQSAFRNLAGKLKQQADSLETQAKNRRFNTISATLNQMRSTCMACHTLFRKF